MGRGRLSKPNADAPPTRKNMNKTALLILGTLFAPIASSLAQRTMTMDECIAYALSHAAEVQTQEVNVRQARDDQRQATFALLPSVSASSGVQWAWGRNIDPETNTYNTVTTFYNSYGLSTGVTLFDGLSNVNCWRRARAARQQSLTRLERTRDDKAVAVMEAYVAAAYAEACVELCQRKLDDSRALLDKTRRLYELGEKARPDVAQMESQAAGDEYDLVHQRNVAEQAVLSLRTAMGMGRADEAFGLAAGEPLLSAPVEAAASADGGGVTTLVEGLPAYREAALDVDRARLYYRMQQGQLAPSLYVSAGVSTNFYRNLSSRYDYDAFSTQLKNNRGEYVSLSLSIPLFDYDRIHSLRSARNSWRLAQIALDDERRQLESDVRQAELDTRGYAAELRQLDKKVEADSLAYHLSRRKYEEGMLSTFDLQTAAQTLVQSRVSRLQAGLMLVVKRRLLAYYHGEPLYRETSISE